MKYCTDEQIKCYIELLTLSLIDSPLRYVYTLRLIGPIEACYTHTKCICEKIDAVLLWSKMGEPLNHIHQDIKSARLIAVCKRSFKE